MDEAEKHTEFEIQGLSLIDVSFEDDCLINPSSVSPLKHSFSENQGQKSVRFMASFDSSNGESPFKSHEETEKEFQPLESSEPEMAGKYNLRKSLAWDNAFFTSEGFLEPEELSSMMGGGGTRKSEKHVLPGIQEDALSRRSTDSLSTLESDTLTMKSLEADLFEDIRASIQKSSKMSSVANSKSNNKLGATESPTTQSSQKVGLSSRDKMKPKVAPKRPVVGTQGSGKAIKQVSVHPQSSQSVAANGESTTSICKPPKVLGKISPHTTISTKRASVVANRIKMEKDNPKISSVAIRGAAASKTPSSGSRNILHRPTLPSRSVRSSVATKKELTSSCSSFDSSGSASSDISRLSMNSIKQRNDSGTCSPCSGSTVKSRSRIASKSNIQSGSSLRSVDKLSSSVSPASSVSERSSGSPASKSTVNQRPKNMRVSLDSRSVNRLSVDSRSDASQILDSPLNYKDKCSVGDDANAPSSHGERVKGTSTGIAALRPPAKPSGLRMPSPKIGFFDGVRSSVRTPNGISMQSHPGLLSASPKPGAGGISPSGSSNKAKLGKLQHARTAMAMNSSKPDVQPTVLNIKDRSSLPLQVPSNATTKVPNPSKNIKGALVSPKLKKNVSVTIGGLTPSKAEQVVCKGHEKSSPDFGLSEKNGSPNVSNDTLSSESKDKAEAPGIKSSPVNEQLNALCNFSFNSDAENINPSQEAGGDVNFGQHIPKNDLYPLCNANEKERTQFKDQVGGPTKQDGVRDIHVVAEKTVALPSPESILTQNSSDVM